MAELPLAGAGMAAGPEVGEPDERDRSDQGSLGKRTAARKPWPYGVDGACSGTHAHELPKGTEMTEPADHGPNPPAVAVLGLGKMGTPIAHNLVAAGFPVVVWNRRQNPSRRSSRPVPTAALSPAAAAGAADIIVTMLADGNAIAACSAGRAESSPPSGPAPSGSRWRPSDSTGPSSSPTSPQTTTSSSSTRPSQAATVRQAPAN